MKVKSIISSILLLILVATTCPSFQEMTAAEDQPEFIKGEVVVELMPGAAIESVNDRHRTSTIQQIYGTNFYRLRTPKGKKENKWRKRLARDTDVLSASLNPVITSPSLFGRSTASFPEGVAKTGLTLANFQAQQELFDLLDVGAANERSRGAGVVVAVIDTGVDSSHSMIASRLWRDGRVGGDIEGDLVDNDGDGLVDDVNGWDFVDNDNDPSESADNPRDTVAGHGTFIAGLIVLLAPQCRILPIRAFPKDGLTDGFTVAAAVKYAADHGANVINLSLGSSESLPLLEEAILDARRRGITIVAAVGNENTERRPQFPSSLDDVIAVAAVELSGHKAAFSNFGGHVDVCAPGVKLVSAYPGGATGEFAEWSGTSFAAPLASAEAALIISVDPRIANVKKVMEESAGDVDGINPGFAQKLGRGRIDPLGALQSLNTGTDIRPPSETHSQIQLVRGPGSTDATGSASIDVTEASQTFVVSANTLSVRSKYSLVVDGNAILSEVSASSLGSINLVFSTRPGHLGLPAALNPVTNIRHVELRDSLGRVALQGDFAETKQPVLRVFEREARLTSTGVLARTGGRTAITIESVGGISRRESFTLLADGLTSDAFYFVVVDGMVTGRFQAGAGFLRVHFSSDGSSGQTLPSQLRPVINIRRVEVQNERGQSVLEGNFRAS